MFQVDNAGACKKYNTCLMTSRSILLQPGLLDFEIEATRTTETTKTARCKKLQHALAPEGSHGRNKHMITVLSDNVGVLAQVFAGFRQVSVGVVGAATISIAASETYICPN